RGRYGAGRYCWPSPPRGRGASSSPRRGETPARPPSPRGSPPPASAPPPPPHLSGTNPTNRNHIIRRHFRTHAPTHFLLGTMHHPTPATPPATPPPAPSPPPATAPRR